MLRFLKTFLMAFTLIYRVPFSQEEKLDGFSQIWSSLLRFFNYYLHKTKNRYRVYVPFMFEFHFMFVSDQTTDTAWLISSVIAVQNEQFVVASPRERTVGRTSLKIVSFMFNTQKFPIFTVHPCPSNIVPDNEIRLFWFDSN